MSGNTRENIAEILKDDSRSKDERIAELLKMREDARALQRAATESPMATGDDGSTGLREIDRALEKLGYNTLADADEEGAATL